MSEKELNKEEKQVWMFLRVKNILATIKEKKLSFQSYLKVNTLEKELEVVLKTVQEKVNVLKTEYDVMADTKNTRVSVLNGKDPAEYTEEEKRNILNWNLFNEKYNEILGEKAVFKSSFTLTELMSTFNKTEEVFVKDDLDVLAIFLGF